MGRGQEQIQADVGRHQRPGTRRLSPRALCLGGDGPDSESLSFLLTADNSQLIAALFDKDPYLPGRLTHTRGPTLLEIPLPPSGAE